MRETESEPNQEQAQMRANNVQGITRTLNDGVTEVISNCIVEAGKCITQIDFEKVISNSRESEALKRQDQRLNNY